MPVPPLRRLVAPAVAAFLALAPAACDLDGRDPDEVQLQQQWVVSEDPPPAPGTPPSADVNGGAGIMSITGQFVRTCTSGNLQLTYTFDGTALTLRAVFTPAASCANEPPTRQHLHYFGYLFNLRADTYQVRMLHENDDLAGAASVVHEETVEIF